MKYEQKRKEKCVSVKREAQARNEKAGFFASFFLGELKEKKSAKNERCGEEEECQLIG